MPIQTRVSPELRDKITAAAERSGRSVAQQVEMMLERSTEDVTPIVEELKKSHHTMMDYTARMIEQTQEMMIEACGGDSIFPLWRRRPPKSFGLRPKNGKSIREDEATLREAERAVLGSITDVFRNLPPPLSESVKARTSLPLDSPFLNNQYIAGPAYKKSEK